MDIEVIAIVCLFVVAAYSMTKVMIFIISRFHSTYDREPNSFQYSKNILSIVVSQSYSVQTIVVTVFVSHVATIIITSVKGINIG